MQIVFIGDNLHEMSKHVFSWNVKTCFLKKIQKVFAEIFTQSIYLFLVACQAIGPSRLAILKWELRNWNNISEK